MDHEGNQVGVVATTEARRMADEVGMDLVEVNPMIDLTGLTPAVAAMTILEFLGAVFG